MKRYEVIIVGGGASGMIAAATAGKKLGGENVLLIEGQQRMGRKLLATGNGRCNLTNMTASEKDYYTDDRKILSAVLSKFGVDDTLRFFSQIGVETMTEDEGRVYPLSEQAASVLDMLRFEIDRRKVCSVTENAVTSVRKQGGRFIVIAGENRYEGRNVIIACGGCAAIQLGANDSGTKLLASLGHKILTPSPALTQMKTNSAYIGALKGMRVDCEASLVKNGKTLYRENGEVLFADGALSGIAVFNLSRFYEQGASVRLRLLCEKNENEIRSILKDRAIKLNDLTLENYLNGMLNKRVANCVLKNAGFSPLSKPVSALSDNDIEKIVRSICCFDFPVSGLSGWKNAQVTRGGAVLSQFDENLQSRICKGLYACGEVLNVDGKCGGYNLQWAWSSGAVCAMAINRKER